MPRRLPIPGEVKADIGRHIATSVADAIDGFDSASEDEDALTGHLGKAVKTGVHIVNVLEWQINGPWRWSLDYTKFRGKGPSATERHVGADGIFEIKLDGGGPSIVKSLLFQSKMEGEGGKRLVEQCSKLSTWREAAFVLSFGKKAFTALSLDDILATRGRVRGLHGAPLSDYLAGPFLDCAVGDTDLRYNRGERRLIWRAMSGETVAVKFVVKHRFRLRVAAPGSSLSIAGFNREVNPDEIHKFRMSASYEDILAVRGADNRL